MLQFESTGSHNPVVFHFDFGDAESSMMSFDVFLVKFEGMIIQTIVDNRVKLFGGENDSDAQHAIKKLLDVAERFYDTNLLEQGIAHSLNRAL